jgi:hypothetical protein
MYFVLMADASYSVEVWACDFEKHEKNVARLNELFGGRASLVKTNSRRPDMSRFLFPPKTKKPYTYISDIDIMVMDPHVAEWHIANLDERCYSNAIREQQPHEKHPRLTGVMFVETDKWYSATEAARRRKHEGSDEMVLAQIAFSVWPEHRQQLESKAWCRPIPGVHMSIAREPHNHIGWEITGNYRHRLKQMTKHATWPEFWEMTEDKWKEQYKRIG